jgi:hypothetical protein
MTCFFEFKVFRRRLGYRRRSAIDINMSSWPDEKIYNNAIWEIRRHSMNPESWRYTRIDNHHSDLVDSCGAADGERPIVTAVTCNGNWYAFTTRRLVGVFRDGAFAVPAHLMTDCSFGDNAKGYGNVELSIATISQGEDAPVTFEFETGKAWMAPEYYVSWWIRKFPLLDVFKFDPASN